MTAATVRVLALDVDRLRGSRPGLLRVLRDTAPDVALLSHVPVHPLSRHRLGALASDVGLLVAVGGPETAGAAVLVSLRAEPTATQTYRGGGGGAALAELRLTAGQRFRVGVVDTRGDDEARATAAGDVLALLGPGDDTPTVLAGDLPGSAGGDVLARRLADLTPGTGATTPADRPRVRPRGLLGGAATARPLDLPGAVGARPDLLSRVTPSRPDLVELVLP
ncbi:hypothetical protein [Aquipuribacter nitratireducens]|uniref:Uncharacterized protein n=1 Tax=Aquipuribacter nitratireducens TaxID=650104 RepID=A0ABW0GRR8_9MICO